MKTDPTTEQGSPLRSKLMNEESATMELEVIDENGDGAITTDNTVSTADTTTNKRKGRSLM